MALIDKVDLVAITGLDEAIIGTTLRDGVEVLCYDFDIAKKIVMNAGWSSDLAEDWLCVLAQRRFDGAPAFIYVGNAQDEYGLDYDDEPCVTLH